MPVRTRLLGLSTAADHAEANRSTAQFDKLAGQVSGQQLHGLFPAWLFSPTEPAKTKANGLV